MLLRNVALAAIVLMIISAVTYVTYGTSTQHLITLGRLNSIAYVTHAKDGVIVVGINREGNAVCLKMSYGLNIEWLITLGGGRIVVSISPEKEYLVVGTVGNALTNVTIVDARNGSVLKSFTLNARVDEVKWVGYKYLALVFEKGSAGHWGLSLYSLKGERVFTTLSLGRAFRVRHALAAGETVVVLNSSLKLSDRKAYAYVVGKGVRYLGKDVVTLSLSPDGLLVALLQRDGNEAYLKVTQVANGYVVLKTPLGNVEEGAIKFSKDGHYVAVAYGYGGSDTLEVFNLSSRSIVLRTKVLEGEPLVDFISWSPYSKYLLIRGAKGLEVIDLKGDAMLSKTVIGDVDGVYWFPNYRSVGLIVEDETMGYDYFMLLSISRGTVLKAIHGGVVDEYFLNKPYALGLVFKDGGIGVALGKGNVTYVAPPRSWHAEHLLLKYLGGGSMQAIVTYSSIKGVPAVGKLMINTAITQASLTSSHVIPTRNVSLTEASIGVIAVIIAFALLIVWKARYKAEVLITE